MSKEETKIFHYKHYINEFLADTYIHSSLEKYAYLTIIWEAYRKKGYVDNKSLNRLMELNPDIPSETYQHMIQKYFTPDEQLGYYHQKIIDELNKTGYLKKAGEKGGNATALKNMIKSDANIDEYNRIWKAYKGTRLHSERGVEQYCKAKLSDKTGLFNIDNLLSKVEWLNNRFEKDNINIPMMATFFNDRDSKYWKSGQEKQKVDRISVANKLAHEDNNFYNLTKEEQNERINSYTE